MRNLTEALEFRDQLRAELAGKPAAAKLAVLSPHLSPPRRSRELALKAAVARTLLVAHELHLDPKEAHSHLKAALKTFQEAVHENRKFRLFVKDIEIFRGHVFAQEGRVQPAIQAYERALVNEHDEDRRALVTLNMTRTYVAAGEFHRALTLAEKFKMERITDPVLRSYLVLLKARIFLTLGFFGAASQALTLVGEEPPLVALEGAYLRALTAFAPDKVAAFVGDFFKFANWVGEHYTEAEAAFYELEGAIYDLLTAPSARELRVKPARAKLLGRKAVSPALERLYSRLHELFYATEKKDSHFKSALLALTQLVGNGNQALFQIALLLMAQRFMASQHYGKAKTVLQEFAIYHQRLEEGFSGALRKRLGALPSALKALHAELKAVLPARYSEGEESMGELLFSAGEG